MLDAEIQGEVLALLKSLQKRLGLAILFITHDLSVAGGFCQRVIVLDGGKVLEEGIGHEIITRPKEKLTKSLVAASPRLPLERDRLTPSP